MDDKELLELMQELKEKDEDLTALEVHVLHKKEINFSTTLLMIIAGAYSALLVFIRLLTGNTIQNTFVYFADILFVINMILLPSGIKNKSDYNRIFCSGISYAVLMFAIATFVHVF